MARQDREDEFVATAQAAHLLGWHVGQVIPMGFYTNAQSPTSKPLRRLGMRLTGIVTWCWMTSTATRPSCCSPRR
jgi:hypothetical protein